MRDHQNHIKFNIQGTVRIVGYASKAGLGVGRSDSERPYCFCNGRPVDLPRVVKTMNEVFFLLLGSMYLGTLVLAADDGHLFHRFMLNNSVGVAQIRNEA